MKSLSANIREAAHTFADPIVESNPITVQFLGLCSALAVTSSLLPALVMGAAVFSVLVFSNVLVSALRGIMPQSIRLVVEMTLISSAVIVVDQVLGAFMREVSAVLSVFVGLIITNCLVLARADGFAARSPIWPSFLDALGNGLGYAVVLALIGSIRELTGSGTLLGRTVFETQADGGWYTPNELMLLSPSAFFLIGILIWILRSLRHPTRATQPGMRKAQRG